VKAQTLSRRELAKLLHIHPDSVSRNLTAGLACAVTRWDSRGRAMLFDRAQALRWAGAFRCPSKALSWTPCRRCWTVMEDCAAVGEHLAEARHGYAGCVECGRGMDWQLGQPCQQSTL
jgi:hypothetical protein